ncbi:MAG TPA: sigma-70 family RNA polymerase sigma factor [Humisphaera sp.]
MPAELTPTRPSLLLRVRDPRDAAAWGQFVDLYTPLVFGFCTRRGLQSADAADVAQDVLRAVAAAIGRFDYDPTKGAFRDWLFAVTRSKLSAHVGRSRRHPRGSGDTGVQALLEAQPDDAADDAAEWTTAWQRQLFDYAAAQVKAEFQPGTWRAFWATAVEGRSAADVGAELGMTAGAVYIARSRVLKRVRQVVEEIDDRAEP